VLPAVPRAPAQRPRAGGLCVPPRARRALTRLGQDCHHVLGQAHGGDEVFKLLQELGAPVLPPHCSQTPEAGAGGCGGTQQRAPRRGSGSHGAVTGPRGRAKAKPWRCRVGTRHPMAALGWQRRGTNPLGWVTHPPWGVRGGWRGWGSTAGLAHCRGALVHTAVTRGHFQCKVSFTPKLIPRLWLGARVPACWVPAWWHTLAVGSPAPVRPPRQELWVPIPRPDTHRGAAARRWARALAAGAGARWRSGCSPSPPRAGLASLVLLKDPRRCPVWQRGTARAPPRPPLGSRLRFSQGGEKGIAV